VKAIRLGAYDFLTKPIDVNHLRLVLGRASRERNLQEEVAHLREQLGHQFAFHNILSKSPAMHAVFALIQNVAATISTVLIERVGGTESIEMDVRVIGATNRSLGRLVKKGKFREDLFYRLNVVKIDLPPLRERLEDVPLLAAHFAARYARPGEKPLAVSPAAM